MRYCWLCFSKMRIALASLMSGSNSCVSSSASKRSTSPPTLTPCTSCGSSDGTLRPPCIARYMRPAISAIDSINGRSFTWLMSRASSQLALLSQP